MSIEGATVLIVDDTPGNLGTAVDSLEACGLRVLVAQDGEEGVARARFAMPDLILLDVMLPGIDGFETCRRLKADKRTRDIPVIFMTALGSAADKRAGFEAGGVDYISKPFNVTEATARVGVHVALRRAQLELGAQNRALRREVRERREAQEAAQLAREALAASEDRYRKLVESSLDAILIVQGGVIVFANPAAVELYGAQQADALVGRAMFALVAPESREDAVAAVEALDQGLSLYVQDEKGLRLDGDLLVLAVTRVTFAFEGAPAIQVVARDVSGAESASLRVRRAALRDAVTGLPNRNLLVDRLRQAIAHARRQDASLVVCALDLDRFGSINERLGHEAGDGLLKAVAARLSGCLRETDTVARLGADEFVLVLEDAGDAGEAMEVVNRVMASFAAPFDVAGRELGLTCSVGCSRYPEGGSRPEALLELAEAALEASRSGGDALKASRPEPSAAQTLLVLDSDPLATAAVARLLRSGDYRVLTANRADQAFELLARNDVGVVLSELRPGDDGGPEFLDIVRRRHPRAVRLVFAARRDADTAAAAVALGAAHRFLLKPFEDAELRSALAEAFSGKAPSSPGKGGGKRG